MLSKNRFSYIRKYKSFLDIKKSFSDSKKRTMIFWYQKFKFLISINNLFFWYQEFDSLISENHFLISQIRILDIRKSFFDIKESNKNCLLFLISENRFFYIRKYDPYKTTIDFMDAPCDATLSFPPVWCEPVDLILSILKRNPQRIWNVNDL